MTSWNLRTGEAATDGENEFEEVEVPCGWEGCGEGDGSASARVAVDLLGERLDLIMTHTLVLSEYRERPPLDVVRVLHSKRRSWVT